MTDVQPLSAEELAIIKERVAVPANWGWADLWEAANDVARALATIRERDELLAVFVPENPIITAPWYEGETRPTCRYCGEVVEPSIYGSNHTPDCPWRRARERLGKVPASGKVEGSVNDPISKVSLSFDEPLPSSVRAEYRYASKGTVEVSIEQETIVNFTLPERGRYRIHVERIDEPA